jgi:surface carbohydrate biosynthesis protein (TIGR04326 family)
MAIKNLFQLSLIYCRLGMFRKALVANGFPVWTWLILASDIKDSIYGRTAAQNLIWHGVLDAAIQKLPKQRLGLYLCENQGWERSMIYLWKKYGHKKLIAVAHSTIRYWDLRYFEDPRIFCDEARLSLPIPDKLAVNSPYAFRAMSNAGYPISRLVEVEAQRYLNYSKNNSFECVTKTVNYEALNIILDSKMRLLVLGDIMNSSNLEMMGLLEKCAPFLNEKFTITVKPHPNCPIAPGDYPSLFFQVNQSPLSKFTEHYDIAFSANSTSAALDMLLFGTGVIVHLTPGEINLSPTRGMSQVRFVSSAEELLDSLTQMVEIPLNIKPLNYFYTGNQLMRWNALLE